MTSSASSPASSGPGLAIEHDAARSRFRTVVDGLEGIAEYRLAGNVLRLTHTEVPAALEGRGIASALVREALAFAARQGLKVEPRCSFARGYMQRHPETHGLLA